MSKQKRYDLLNSWMQSASEYQHTLSTALAEPQNNIVIFECISAWVFLLEDLLQDYPETSRNRRITNWLRATYLNDFQDVVSLCKSAYDLLIDDSTCKSYTYARFKDELIQCVPGFLSINDFLSPIAKILATYLQIEVLVDNHCFKTQGVLLLEILAQFFSFPLKLTFVNMGLEEKALTDYLKSEAETASWHINIDNHELCTHVKSILTTWLADFDYDGSKCQHGPGSVADITDKSVVSKFYALKSDKFLSIVMRTDDDGPDILEQQAPLGLRKTPLKRCSKLVFVPKNVTKLRSISMEPTTLQYVQQGVQIALRDYIDRHPYLSKIINLGNQMQNRSFAYTGSITNDYATIDLSHASDSVNWECVKYVFSGVPKLLKWLIATRSTHTLLPDGSELLLKKFAPMGSSLCFPIETLIFAAIAQCSIVRARQNLFQSTRKFERAMWSDLSLTIYGDDIILPTYAAQQCIDVLKILGYSPNMDKTFITGAFKESCGGNYYCGHDVTAIKFNPIWDCKVPNGITPETFNSLASTANLAEEHNYTFLRLYCIKRIMSAGFSPLFSDTSEQSPAIFSKQPTNYHLRVKFLKLKNKDGKVMVVRKLGTCTSVKTNPQKDWFRVVNKVFKKDKEFVDDCLQRILYYQKLRMSKRCSTSEYNLNYETKTLEIKLPNSMGLTRTFINGNTLMFQPDVRVGINSLVPSVVVFNRCVVEL